MNSLILAILLFALVASVTGAIFWPRYGMMARLARNKPDKKRILAEDCLKYLHNREYRGLVSRRADIAKTFGLSADETDALLSGLQTAGLIRLEVNIIHLTETGRADALQIVRIHRLLEQYLAEQTGLKEAEWHTTAEDREHTTTPAEANEMAAQLGNPVYDPHGDPIPTDTGEMPDWQGQPLNEMAVGAVAKITHIEDEPPEVYARLVALGFQPGAIITCLAKERDRIVVRFGDSEEELDVALQKNITVRPVEDPAAVQQSFKRLSALKPGERAHVVGISKACRGQQRRRLMDLGVVPGSVISAELRSVSGDPTAYQIRGALIALRNQQAEHIYIQDEFLK